MVILAVAPVAVIPSASIVKPAGNVWVHIYALVPVAALRKEFAFLTRMHILTLCVRLVALGPVLAANQNFISFLLLATILCSISEG